MWVLQVQESLTPSRIGHRRCIGVILVSIPQRSRRRMRLTGCWFPRRMGIRAGGRTRPSRHSPLAVLAQLRAHVQHLRYPDIDQSVLDMES
jgi:hypothetical protein